MHHLPGAFTTNFNSLIFCSCDVNARLNDEEYFIMIKWSIQEEDIKIISFISHESKIKVIKNRQFCHHF